MSAGHAGNACDRECLKGAVDRVLDALVKHDAASVSWASQTTIIHNGRPENPGDGDIWNSIDGIAFRQYVLDPNTGSAALFAVATENNQRGTLFMRIAIDRSHVKVLEVVSGERNTDGIPGLISPNPLFDYVLPRAQRRDRQQLIDIANSYFEGLEHHDGSKVPVSADCRRFEDGVQTSLNPVFLPIACNDFRPFKYIDQTAKRIYPIVDVERGLVLGQMVIQVSQAAGPPSAPGPAPQLAASDSAATHVRPPVNPISGMVMPHNEWRAKPHDTIIHELFKIVDGNITEIQTIRLDRPYGWGGGW
jgi:hypothetical protein